MGEFLGLDGRVSPLQGSVKMLCWGSDHISRCQGQVLHWRFGAAALCAPRGERSCPWSTSVGSAPAGSAGMAPWCTSRHGVWGQWGQPPPNPPCGTGRDPLGALSIPRRSQVHPLALRGRSARQGLSSSTGTFLPSVTATQTVSQRCSQLAANTTTSLETLGTLGSIKERQCRPRLREQECDPAGQPWLTNGSWTKLTLSLAFHHCQALPHSLYSGKCLW